MRLRDIPKLTRTASYVVEVSWDSLEHTLAHYDQHPTVLELDPEFQRAHVWDDLKRQRYVEYVLRGGKSSRDIYFNHANWMGSWHGTMYLVDGKQRLEAVLRFLHDDLPVGTDWPGYPTGGLVLSQFEDRLSHEHSFKFHVNDLATYPEVLQWYLDLNEGGVVHTQTELDHVRQLLAAWHDS